MTINAQRFVSREQAAELLAQELIRYKGRHPLVLAIPRGAVPMGSLIASQLDGELDIVLTHKLCAPMDPEYAIGAIDESGWVYISPLAARAGISPSYLEQEKERQLDSLKHRRIRFKSGKKPAAVKGRIAIVVDDGLATGATMIAALHAIRAREPARLVCAIPVAPSDTLDRVSELADEVICLQVPDDFRSVGQFYQHFPQVEEDEVIRILSAS
ncbi:MAG: phosphoribosyltransferase [Oxalobacteraceae bacterium]|jgi:putative phosphoribosyl transferase|nr:phosphoribosyltransferase [Oxalobacteraceae bacterium]